MSHVTVKDGSGILQMRIWMRATQTGLQMTRRVRPKIVLQGENTALGLMIYVILDCLFCVNIRNCGVDALNHWFKETWIDKKI